jgi:hypothetical protein
LSLQRIEIDDFKSNKQKIDFTAFSSLYTISDLSYSVNPLIIYPQGISKDDQSSQMVILSSHTSMRLIHPESFVFRPLPTVIESSNDLDLPAIIALVVLVFCGCSAGICILVSKRKHQKSGKFTSSLDVTERFDEADIVEDELVKNDVVSHSLSVGSSLSWSLSALSSEIGLHSEQVASESYSDSSHVEESSYVLSDHSISFDSSLQHHLNNLNKFGFDEKSDNDFSDIFHMQDSFELDSRC